MKCKKIEIIKITESGEESNYALFGLRLWALLKRYFFLQYSATAIIVSSLVEVISQGLLITFLVSLSNWSEYRTNDLKNEFRETQAIYFNFIIVRDIWMLTNTLL